MVSTTTGHRFPRPTQRRLQTRDDFCDSHVVRLAQLQYLQQHCQMSNEEQVVRMQDKLFLDSLRFKTVDAVATNVTLEHSEYGLAKEIVVLDKPFDVRITVPNQEWSRHLFPEEVTVADWY
eukprot:gnl/TRDRNA2_/TRDRNA2_171176_c3_seq4.p1 gnl/TRDRNA2_/TRDRNA2_171176_c3~~gnl/TRDRNA2_/TRDRNA2_171176_c3_seq4.p1  ORF type:complete len:121 (+),score=24.70 gnl/TRDRNA2_/TRDRNA2_171176_c3_seq4:3-365(+)